MISFNQIPVRILTPGSFVELDSSQANSGLAKPRNRTIIIAQKLATGTAAANALTRANSADDAKVKFGVGSMAARMVAFYKKTDPYRELWVVPMLDLVAGVKASGTITINSAPSVAGTLYLMIGGQSLKIPTLPTNTPTEIATAIAATINAQADLPVTATSNAAVVTITARHKGTLGNGIDIRFNHYQDQAFPAGFGATLVAMSGGTGDPDLTDAIAAIGNEVFMTWVCPYLDTENLTIMKSTASQNTNAMVGADCHFMTAKDASHGSLLDFADNHNSEFGAGLGIYKSPSPNWEIAASLAGAIAQSSDIDPALPFEGLPLIEIVAPREADRFTRQEREYLLEAGISTAKVNADGVVTIDRVVTFYKTNPQGFADDAYRSLENLLTLYFYRWSLNYRIATKYPRHKLGNDGGAYSPNAKVVTPNTVRAELISLAVLWVDAGLMENLEDFKKALVVERDATDRDRLNAVVNPDVINQFNVFAAKVQYRK